MSNEQNFGVQAAFMTQRVEELAKKANLKRVPELCISKTERLANVNIFQGRISVGEYLISLWQQGKFGESDMEATLAHEIGHLMDFRKDSRSTSFRNLLFESFWFSFGVAPLFLYLLAPSITILMISAIIAVAWGFSLPWIVRGVEARIELEADRNAALYLVEPQQLADALVKISSFGAPSRKFGFTSTLSVLTGTLTHPSFKERVRNLQSL